MPTALLSAQSSDQELALRKQRGDLPGQRAVFIALRLEALPGRWELIELLY